MVNTGLKINIFGLTDVGRVRTHNEDAVGWDERVGLAILADGMGGHNAGEVASDMAVHKIRSALDDVLSPDILQSGMVNYQEAVHDAIAYANHEIYQASHHRAECAGMGTTVVMTFFHNGEVILANVGDSRIYRFRDNALAQVTSDHSLVQEMIDNGFLSAEQAQTATNRNLITRALGIGEQVEIDICVEPTQPGDVYLLCSDGLSDMVPEGEIDAILQQSHTNPEEASRQLVIRANEMGGADNISVILVNVSEAFSDERGLDDKQVD